MKIHEKLLYSLVAMLLVLGYSCNDTVSTIGDGDPPPPPPPPAYDYNEQEPNDTLVDAQAITILPMWNPEDIGGTFLIPKDSDCYWFFLAPPAGVTQLNFNMLLETDPILLPKVRMYQTIYDDFGDPAGYTLIGTWVGLDGDLVILDVEVPYDNLTNNDLFIKLDPWGGLIDVPLPDDTYVIDFWTN